MRKVYIRHADKSYKNMESELFKHDPGITQVGVERARLVALKLVEEYGPPTKIISSPFRRARETAMIMNMTLKNPFEEIVIDTTLSEYLGNHNDVPLDVTAATAVHKPPHPETFEDMKRRVKKHLENMKKEKFLSTDVVWFITHGLIIKQIGSCVGLKCAKTFPCLTCLSIVEKPDMFKGEFILFQGKLKHEKEEEVYRPHKVQNKIIRLLQKV